MPSGRMERKHKERAKSGEDNRLKSQRDRDRVLYSNSFRRLAGVTQVISPLEGDVVHNRLTHTLKVGQIGRRLSELIIRKTKEEQLESFGGLDPEVVEAAAFAHDLGHPPFGHVGESELNKCLQKDLYEGYEGNAQSFRIVTKLAVRAPDHPGLNLTQATLNALLKYPWLKKTKKDKKWGAYKEEKEFFDWVRKGQKSRQRSLEAEIMDWADDVTYAVHDVEDFYKAGIIPIHLLVRGDTNEHSTFLNATIERWEEKLPERLKQWDLYEKGFNYLMKLLPIRGPYKGTREEQAQLRNIGSTFITRFLNGTSLGEPDSNEPLLRKESNHEYEVEILKELIWHYVIRSTSLVTQQQGYRKIIRELYDIYKSDINCQLVPAWMMAEIEPEASPARRSADIVSSLTDGQAMSLYQRLTGLNPGSITDWV